MKIMPQKLEVIITETPTKLFLPTKTRAPKVCVRGSRDRSRLEGGGRLPTSKGAGKHDVPSRSPDLVKLNPNCHMNYS